MAERSKQAWNSLYASTDRLIWGSEPLPFVEEFLPYCLPALSANGQILDAGTGEGRHLPLLLGTGAEVHAVDASPEGVRKIGEDLRGRVGLIVSDLVRLPYADASFDLALSVDVVETLPEPGKVFAELRRVLRPGGMLLCNIPGEEDDIAGIEMQAIGPNTYLFHDSYYYRFLSEHDATSLLAGHGFEPRRVGVSTWDEAPHPNFRETPHRHTSRVFLVERTS